MPRAVTCVAGVLVFAAAAGAATREVGAGKVYSSIAAALAEAQPGDVILVHPMNGQEAYRRPAVLNDRARKRATVTH